MPLVDCQRFFHPPPSTSNANNKRLQSYPASTDVEQIAASPHSYPVQQQQLVWGSLFHSCCTVYRHIDSHCIFKSKKEKIQNKRGAACSRAMELILLYIYVGCGFWLMIASCQLQPASRVWWNDRCGKVQSSSNGIWGLYSNLPGRSAVNTTYAV